MSHTLRARDEERFLTASLGGLLRDSREPRLSYVVLPDGLLVYAGWYPHYLWEVIQQAVTAFTLDDHLRVKVKAGA